MRRIIIAVLVLSIATAVSARQKVQDTFFGLKFGERHEDIYELPELKELMDCATPDGMGRKTNRASMRCCGRWISEAGAGAIWIIISAPEECSIK